MSHIVQIQTQVRDATAVTAACSRLGLSHPIERAVKLFTSCETGLAVELPGWKFPVGCQLATGTLKYDNFGGRWGEPAQVARFLQIYACENSKRLQCTSNNVGV